MSRIDLPEFSLVVLVGASGSGKSTFARKHFRPTEIVSSDFCRGVVADDENDQTVSPAAFALVHFIAEQRLAGRRLTVIDATNVRPEDRRAYVEIARKYHALPVAIVLDLDERLCHERNAARPDRQFGVHVVRNHVKTLRRNLRNLKREGFRQIHELHDLAQIEAAEITRHPLWTDRRTETGPFDIIGDIHGCGDELEALLDRLGYGVTFSGEGGERSCTVTAPPGRKALFVGDLVDRGPRTPDVLRLVMGMVESGQALCIVGNHENKLLKWLNGRDVQRTHGLAESIAQLEAEPEFFRRQLRAFLDKLVSHYWLDGGRLAIAHAGIKAEMIGRASGAVRDFCMYGESTGEVDEFGLPVRYPWAQDYRGSTQIVYGHTPVPEAEWLNETICIDTGCVFGGKLTALRYPERELVSVPAARTYFEPIRPLAVSGPARGAQAVADDMLDLADVRGKRIISTRLAKTVTVNEANGAAALEVMSRFAMNPKWLAYLPPTMSPSETSGADGWLEHPAEAFAYFRNQGVTAVVCEEKHMGSRAVIAVCRDEAAAHRRFGTTAAETGAIYTRTGRAFFPEAATTEALLARIRAAMEACDFWDRFATDWALLDCELMPWSAKAQGLILEQYAPTGTAARISTEAVSAAYAAARARGVELGALPEQAAGRVQLAERFASVYRRYCWQVEKIADYRIAPFHLLATEGVAHLDKTHLWHMAELAQFAAGGDPVLMATAHRRVDPFDEAQVAEATDW
ncbi:polynucleotide kinase-phosphatase [Hypericibacter terrae]|uniref:Polynucleotide kinase-phosphatase n=1 Tax=Hypericibacter terrae TaxID=2602015 RepID=A0A5J6MIH7_9PROT|nr:polynucleotide kinase-phosphatase [Hypericibacter terrae]